MPYFKNNEVNILLIHIPKTGGTSLETYFSKKYNIELNIDSLYSFKKENAPKYFNFRISLQHQIYKDIFKFKDFLNVNFDNLKIIAAVRNPYERIMSVLFYHNLITKSSTKEEVYNILNNIISKEYAFDNHIIPQYLFLIDENNNLLKNINIIKTENLTNDMQKIGYLDFNIHIYKNTKGTLNYYDYLNKDSIKLINSYYEKDFTYFDYEIL
jgi:hypothetical protein